MLKPYPAEEMEAFPVSKVVNNPRNETAECNQPVT
jgi:putative SOS response-associated peptidase YedK